MGKTCSHAKYSTQITARKKATELGLDPRSNVEKCGVCRKYRVVV